MRFIRIHEKSGGGKTNFRPTNNSDGNIPCGSVIIVRCTVEPMVRSASVAGVRERFGRRRHQCPVYRRRSRPFVSSRPTLLACARIAYRLRVFVPTGVECRTNLCVIFFFLPRNFFFYFRVLFIAFYCEKTCFSRVRFSSSVFRVSSRFTMAIMDTNPENNQYQYIQDTSLASVSVYSLGIILNASNDYFFLTPRWNIVLFSRNDTTFLPRKYYVFIV